VPINIRVMSWNIQKKQTGVAFMARLIQQHQIDICVLLEVPTGLGFGIPFSLITQLNNVPYLAGQWSFQSITVGNEDVTYVWHQAVAAGPNAFMREMMTNSPVPLGGPVLKDLTNNAIYFPTTPYNWTSLPGVPTGRRPAYLSFVTNDGAAARRFTVLNVHAPYNEATSIQSYTTALYARSREITQVERTHVRPPAQAASLGLPAVLTPLVTPVINLMGAHAFVNIANLVNAAIAGALAEFDNTETNLGRLMLAAAYAGIDDAVATMVVPIHMSDYDGDELAKACAIAAGGAAMTMVASVQLPTAPPAAMATAAAARAALLIPLTAWVGQFSYNPYKPSLTGIRKALCEEAKWNVRVALAPFTFAALPLDAVNSSIVMGDFNVQFPDNIGYSAAQQLLLGGAGNNAYTRLLALGAARNQARTTRVGPSAYKGNRTYTLHNPCPIQHVNNGLLTYVPLDLTALAALPTTFMGNDSWSTALRTLATAQGQVWATLSSPPYSTRLDGAFDMQVLNDTSFYRSSCYDNLFVRNAVVGASGMIDVMSELGSWGLPMAPSPNPQPALAANPWPAATATLNALATATLNVAGTVLTFTYSGNVYTITPALGDAEDAAIFFDRYLSDHLPVFAAVQL
jgi:hypothetical protein